jgi:hypothetical protein
MKSARLLFLSFALALSSATAAIAAKPPAPTDRSLHVYRESMDGGDEIVVAHHVAEGLVRAIRSGLRKEASRYARGEYPDPAGNGKTPAVTQLRAGAARISVSYVEIKDGGAIRFVCKDPSLVSALHAWFAATVTENRKRHPTGGPGFGD